MCLCTHHPPFSLSLSPARLLHSYVCPSLLFAFVSPLLSSVRGCRCFSDNSNLNLAQGESRHFSAPMKFETVDGRNRILVGAM